MVRRWRGSSGGLHGILRQQPFWQANGRLHRRPAAMVSCHQRNAALALRAQRHWSHARLVPGIHLFRRGCKQGVNGRDEPGHDDLDEEYSMATHKLLLLPGDGIGPEVMAEVKRVIDWLNAQGLAHFETEQGTVGGAAYDASKQSITDATVAKAMAADAVIF